MKTYSAIAEPSKLLVNDSLFTELPYNEKIYVKKGDYNIVKVKHAEDIGVYRFYIIVKHLLLTYNPTNRCWVSIDWELF